MAQALGSTECTRDGTLTSGELGIVEAADNPRAIGKLYLCAITRPASLALAAIRLLTPVATTRFKLSERPAWAF